MSIEQLPTNVLIQVAKDAIEKVNADNFDQEVNLITRCLFEIATRPQGWTLIES